MKTGVIYSVYFRGANVCYIGATWDYLERWARHRRSLLVGAHKNHRVQEAFVRYGGDSALRFGVVEWVGVCTAEELAAKERAALEKFVARHGRVALLNNTLKCLPRSFDQRRAS